MPKLLRIFLILSLVNFCHANEEIEQINDLLIEADYLEGEFQQSKTLKDFPFPLKSQGHFKVEMDNYLQWFVVSPVESSLEVNLKQRVAFMDGEVVDTENARTTHLIADVLVSLLSRDWQKLENYFELTATVQQEHWQVGLKPEHAMLGQIIDSISMSGSSHLDALSIVDKEGDITHIEFSIHAAEKHKHKVPE